MLKDIPEIPLTECGIALVPADDHAESGIWEVYFLNLKEQEVKHVLVNAQGRGTIKGSEKATATIRYYLENVPARSAKLVEAMLPELFAIKNEYRVSFKHNDYMFDKKYVVEPNLIKDGAKFFIPLLGKVGRWVE